MACTCSSETENARGLVLLYRRVGLSRKRNPHRCSWLQYYTVATDIDKLKATWQAKKGQGNPFLGNAQDKKWWIFSAHPLVADSTSKQKLSRPRKVFVCREAPLDSAEVSNLLGAARAAGLGSQKSEVPFTRTNDSHAGWKTTTLLTRWSCKVAVLTFFRPKVALCAAHNLPFFTHHVGSVSLVGTFFTWLLSAFHYPPSANILFDKNWTLVEKWAQTRPKISSMYPVRNQECSVRFI